MALRLEFQEPQGLPGQVERWGIDANPLNGCLPGRINCRGSRGWKIQKLNMQKLNMR